jgi:hypothetical protein
MARHSPNSCSSGTSLHFLNQHAARLITSSLAPASRDLYKRAVALFSSFHKLYYKSSNFFPAPPQVLLAFITHLHLKGYAPATIRSYSTAVCFFNKLLGHNDYSTSFLLNKALTGIQREGQASTPRSPIHIHLLHQLVDHISSLSTHSYISLLFRSMFLLAFYAFLRVGEFTTRRSSQANTVLQLSDTSFIPCHDGQSRSLQITLRHFKGNTNRQPVSILIPPTKDIKYCPVSTLQSYLYMRGANEGPLFRLPNGSPITRSIFSSFLQQCLHQLGIPDVNIKPHSFRIGAATSACARGIPDHEIQRMGRWKSDAYKHYIRIPNLLSHF